MTTTAISLRPVDADVAEIARIVARESAETFVLQREGLRVRILTHVLRPPAGIVSRRFVRFDRALGELGPSAGASSIVGESTSGLDVRGSELVPRSGPLLVVANHPGISDAVALLAAIARDDIWIVAAEFPFLRALRHASRRFLFVPERTDGRRAALRHVIARLRSGEAVLLFPAGGLELDPDLAPEGAAASLDRWSRSAALLARRARGTQVLPALVRGVVSRAAFEHPLARGRSPVRERQRMAAVLQLAHPRFQRVRVSVRFASTVTPRRGRDMHADVLARMRALLAEN